MTATAGTQAPGASALCPAYKIKVMKVVSYVLEAFVLLSMVSM